MDRTRLSANALGLDPVPLRDTETLSTTTGTSASTVEKPSTSSSSTILAVDATTKLESPLAALTHEELLRGAEEFAEAHGLAEHREMIKKGALVAQSPEDYEALPLLSAEDRKALRRAEELAVKISSPSCASVVPTYCSAPCDRSPCTLARHRDDDPWSQESSSSLHTPMTQRRAPRPPALSPASVRPR